MNFCLGKIWEGNFRQFDFRLICENFFNLLEEIIVFVRDRPELLIYEQEKRRDCVKILLRSFRLLCAMLGYGLVGTKQPIYECMDVRFLILGTPSHFDAGSFIIWYQRIGFRVFKLIVRCHGPWLNTKIFAVPLNSPSLHTSSHFDPSPKLSGIPKVIVHCTEYFGIKYQKLNLNFTFSMS